LLSPASPTVIAQNYSSAAFQSHLMSFIVGNR
jgi:hypothetical protein